DYIVLKTANDVIVHYEGIPSQSVQDAIFACQKTMMPERLEDATREAKRQGYITGEQAVQLFKKLEQA
ncbi:MAG: hypothetical protein RR477_08935, partial [Raoultibacter sp.]